MVAIELPSTFTGTNADDNRTVNAENESNTGNGNHIGRGKCGGQNDERGTGNARATF